MGHIQHLQQILVQQQLLEGGAGAGRIWEGRVGAAELKPVKAMEASEMTAKAYIVGE